LYVFCDAGQAGAVHVVVELVGVSVWPPIVGGGLLLLVSGFQTYGGGGVLVGVGLTFVQVVTDSVEVPPGWTVVELGLRETDGGAHEGSSARGKSYVVFEFIGSVTGFETPGSTE
jgi:hypothetical protein